MKTSIKAQRYSVNTLTSFVMLSMILFISGSCSVQKRTTYSEPKIISVRNNSGTYLPIVSLREVPDAVGKSVRMGSVSPVPNGATQIVGRPSPPPPLPKQIIISWIDSDQRQYEKEVLLEHILSNSVEPMKDSLVFEIGPFGKINVFCE